MLEKITIIPSGIRRYFEGLGICFGMRKINKYNFHRLKAFHFEVDISEGRVTVMLCRGMSCLLYWIMPNFVFGCWCVCFGWNRVNLLHRGSYDAMIWICGGNRRDNTPMFRLLLSSAYTSLWGFLLVELPWGVAGPGRQISTTAVHLPPHLLWGGWRRELYIYIYIYKTYIYKD